MSGEGREEGEERWRVMGPGFCIRLGLYVEQAGHGDYDDDDDDD